MSRLSNRCPYVTHNVVVRLSRIARPGEEVTDEMWNTAYKLERGFAIAMTYEWKEKHLTKVQWR